MIYSNMICKLVRAGETSEDVHEADGEDSQASESDAAEPPSGSDSD